MRLVVPVIAGLVVFVALVPYSGIDTAPPECYSIVGYVVPCGSGSAVAGGLVALGLVVLGMIIGRGSSVPPTDPGGS